MEPLGVQPHPHILEVTDDLVMLRALLAAQVKALQESPQKGRERALVITKLQEASFWAGQALFDPAPAAPRPGA